MFHFTMNNKLNIYYMFISARFDTFCFGIKIR